MAIDPSVGSAIETSYWTASLDDRLPPSALTCHCERLRDNTTALPQTVLIRGQVSGRSRTLQQNQELEEMPGDGTGEMSMRTAPTIMGAPFTQHSTPGNGLSRPRAQRPSFH